MNHHLSPAAIAWVRQRIIGSNCAMLTTKSQRAKQSYDDERRPLIELLTTFTGADRDELRKLTAKP